MDVSYNCTICDSYSTHAKGVLCSVIPVLAGKCVYYAMSLADIAVNIRGVARELLRKGYLDSWWIPKFRYGLTRKGVHPTIVAQEPNLVRQLHHKHKCTHKAPYTPGPMSIDIATAPRKTTGTGPSTSGVGPTGTR